MIKNGYDVPVECIQVQRDGNGVMHWFTYRPEYSRILGAYVKQGPYGIMWGRAKKAKIPKVRT